MMFQYFWAENKFTLGGQDEIHKQSLYYVCTVGMQNIFSRHGSSVLRSFLWLHLVGGHSDYGSGGLPKQPHYHWGPCGNNLHSKVICFWILIWDTSGYLENWKTKYCLLLNAWEQDCSKSHSSIFNDIINCRWRGAFTIDPLCISPTLFYGIEFWGELGEKCGRDTILHAQSREERGYIHEVGLIE